MNKFYPKKANAVSYLSLIIDFSRFQTAYPGAKFELDTGKGEITMKEWYYAIEGQSFGPFAENELSSLVRDGVLTPYTLVWNNELDNAEIGWIQASDTELNILFPQSRAEQSRAEIL